MWQREALKGSYPEFEPALVQKDREIVKNPKQGKDASFYEEGLRRVYSECWRVLKDDGLLVFTFHHRTSEAWSNVLRAILDAGFRITATYPVHSEMPLSVHIRQDQSISYDAILVCRKRLWNAPTTWAAVEEKVRGRVSETLGRLERYGHRVSAWNQFVVLMGKCLECYSLHFPEVLDGDGSTVSLEEAVARMKRLADVMLDGWAPDEGTNAGPRSLWEARVSRDGGGRWQ